MQELNSLSNNYDFVFYNIQSFNRNMNVDEKRSSIMNIFKKIVYDPKTDTFEYYFK